MTAKHKHLILAFIFFTSQVTMAANKPLELPHLESKMVKLSKYQIEAKAALTQTELPPAPKIAAKSYILVDALSGRILAGQEPDLKLPPASLTKMMSVYVISDAVRRGQISLADKTKISKKAWQMGGSKMFLKAGSLVSIQDLVRGAIIASGNDATIALAEYLAGSEEEFVNLMNAQAKALGMTNTNFMDSTGLPHPDHYTTARDMAILTRALINNFPDEYQQYKQKWFKWNNIKQPNRNRLLWRDVTVDGVKTGHTDEAGYCLAASAKQKHMRLISIVMGAVTESNRFTQTQHLLHYGFRYYETRHIFDAFTEITRQRTWQGKTKTTAYGLGEDLYITIPRGNYHRITAQTNLNELVIAPVKRGQRHGHLEIKYDGEDVMSLPLIALETTPQGGIWRQLADIVRMTTYSLLGSNTE